MSQSTRTTRARGEKLVERVDDPEKTLRQERRRRIAMDSSDIGLADNAPNESEANPATTGQSTDAQSPEDVTPPQITPPPIAAADGEDP